ncbi:hypothetical protein PtB15_9B602 [Puccinia triticina]|nr:hypothetical protein PtB15_9B602 [Puccinia triticina]
MRCKRPRSNDQRRTRGCRLLTIHKLAKGAGSVACLRLACEPAGDTPQSCHGLSSVRPFKASNASLTKSLAARHPKHDPKRPFPGAFSAIFYPQRGLRSPKMASIPLRLLQSPRRIPPAASIKEGRKTARRGAVPTQPPQKPPPTKRSQPVHQATTTFCARGMRAIRRAFPHSSGPARVLSSPYVPSV